MRKHTNTYIPIVYKRLLCQFFALYSKFRRTCSNLIKNSTNFDFLILLFLSLLLLLFLKLRNLFRRRLLSSNYIIETKFSLFKFNRLLFCYRFLLSFTLRNLDSLLKLELVIFCISFNFFTFNIFLKINCFSFFFLLLLII